MDHWKDHEKDTMKLPFKAVCYFACPFEKGFEKDVVNGPVPSHYYSTAMPITTHMPFVLDKPVDT